MAEMVSIFPEPIKMPKQFFYSTFVEEVKNVSVTFNLKISLE